MGRYAKGWTAGLGAVLQGAMAVSDQFCGTWLPAIVGLLTAVGVWGVPNSPAKPGTAEKR